MGTEAPAMTFAEAFDADLRTSGLEQSKVCELLSVDDPVPISSAAISNWKKRNTLPGRRLAKLVEIFGQTSRCALYLEWVLAQNITGTKRVVSTDPSNRIRRIRESPIRTVRDPGAVQWNYQREVLQAPPRYISPSIRPHQGKSWSEIVSAIRDHVPDKYQNGFDLEFKIGEIGSRFDFIGENSIIAFTRLSSLLFGGVYRQMFRMAMIQKLVGPAGRHKAYVIAVRTDMYEGEESRLLEPEEETRHLRAFRRIATEARIMGIQMELADDPEKAAKMIVSWETKPLSLEEEEEEEDE